MLPRTNVVGHASASSAGSVAASLPSTTPNLKPVELPVMGIVQIRRLLSSGKLHKTTNGPTAADPVSLEIGRLLLRNPTLVKANG
jgi:hypothetical protein